MAVTPGVTVSRITSRTSPAVVDATASDVLYLIGFSDRGSTTAPTRLEGMADYATKLGLRTSVNGDDNTLVYDALDAYFALGGRVAYFQRYVGPAAVVASNTILDGSSAIVGTVRAASAGGWGNTITFTVQTNAEDATIPAGSFVIIVYVSTVEVERSPILADKTALLAWAPATAGTGTAQYVGITSGASANDPAATVARALASGAGDRASATTTQFQAALDLLTADLGPGQVAFPGATTAASHALLEAHANTHTRVALCDMTDTATIATVTGVAATDRAATGNEFGGGFWPWPVIQGLTQGTTRTVSPGVVAAALMARSDNAGNTPNVPAAADNGILGDFVVGLSQVAVTDAIRGTLNEAGINVYRAMRTGIKLYGYRTFADPLSNADWVGLNSSRFFQYLDALLNVGGETFAFDEITAAKIAEFKGHLLGILSPFYPGSLVGETSDEAFTVDVSGNTPAYQATNRMTATAEVHIAGMAERVQINVRKVALTEALAA